ncbi:type VII secretion target [Nocardia sp. NPDC004722]
MPDHLVVDPADLRRVAEEHRVAAAKLRIWGQIPEDWLADFERAYGAIAEPVRLALVDHYNARHDKAERLAADHDRTHDQLLRAAADLEDRDREGQQRLLGEGGRGGSEPVASPPTTAPNAPVPTAPSAGPMPFSTTPGQIPTAVTQIPAAPGQIPATSTQVPWTTTAIPPASVPSGEGSETLLPRGASMPPSADAAIPQTYGLAQMSSAAPIAPASNTAPPTRIGTPPMVGTPVSADGRTPAATRGGDRPGVSAPQAVGPGRGPVGPFTRSPEPVRTSAPAPSLPVTGDGRTSVSPVPDRQPFDELWLVRTVLAATLAAVDDSVPGLEWAAAVATIGVGTGVLLTSTEGRGWLPPGLFLPSGIIIPWHWDAAPDEQSPKSLATLSDGADPAAMLTDFASIVHPRRGFRITTLASSMDVSDGIRAALGKNVAVAHRVTAAEAQVDFSAPSPGLVDRLALTGSDTARERAITVPDANIRAVCAELMRKALLLARHLARDPFFEHRIDELRMLTVGEPDRQTLRDALYAYDHLVDSPLADIF